MMNFLIKNLLVAALLSGTLVFGADAQAGGNVPAARASLLPGDLAAFEFGGKEASNGRLERVAVEGRHFTNAFRIETCRKPARPWDIRIGTKTIAPIRKGDTLLATFCARRIESRQETGEALVQIVVEEARPEYYKALEAFLSVGPQWTVLSAPFRADRDYAAGEAQLSLRLGYEPQVIEVADIRLLDYGPDTAPAQLARTASLYDGHEPDANWRKAAMDRIEKLRKANLAIHVVDQEGRSVPNATVSLRMLRHEFTFGTAVAAGAITSSSPESDRYRAILEQNFNKIVFENDLKWPSWEGNPDRRKILQTIQWARERQIKVRGHVMVWPSWKNLPERLQSYQSAPDKLRSEVIGHIQDQVRTLRGQIDEWDVINESYEHNDLMRLLGREVMADWFKTAHQEDPSIRLFYNDYIMFQGSGRGSPSQYYFDTVKFLKKHGAPIHGLGEQGHFGGSPPPPERILKTLDQFAALGLPIQITEFDIDTADEELQTAYTRDFLTAAFSHPSVSGVMLWGFWEGRHWKPRAALWRKDWTLRPHGEAFLQLVKKDWWTHAELTTDADGRARLRGFRGDYEVGVDGKPAMEVRLGGEGVDITVRRK